MDLGRALATFGLTKLQILSVWPQLEHGLLSIGPEAWNVELVEALGSEEHVNFLSFLFLLCDSFLAIDTLRARVHVDILLGMREGIQLFVFNFLHHFDVSATCLHHR